MKLKYIYTAFALYVITAYFSVGHNSPDEYYQILEFAAYKLGLGDPRFLMWEYHSQIRGSLQPWIVVIIYKALTRVAITNPFVIAFVIRLLSGMLSLVAVIIFIKAFISSIKTEEYKRWFVLLSLFTWLIVYNSIRFSSENFSAKLFLLGFSLLFLPNLRRSFFTYLGIGLLLGLSFITRFQSGILVLALLIWLIWVNNFSVINGINKKVINWNKFLVLCLGILIAIIIGVMIDKCFYSNWVFTAWNYLDMNLLQGKAASFGENQWYFYLVVAALLPYGPFYVYSTILCAIYKIKHPVVLATVIFVILHSLIGHKELRFLVPVISFMPLLIIYSFETITAKYSFAFGIKLKKLWQGLWGFNCFLVVLVAFLPSGTQLVLCKALYDMYDTPAQLYYFTEGGHVIDFYKRKNMQLTPIDVINQVKCDADKVCLVALTCQQVVANPQIAATGKVVYFNCPKWLLNLNFNGWLDRSAVYNVYELKHYN